MKLLASGACCQTASFKFPSICGEWDVLTAEIVLGWHSAKTGKQHRAKNNLLNMQVPLAVT
jgi:hypothetical protein